MAELRAPEQNRLLGQLARMLRTTEGDIAAPEFLPKGLDVMGLVRQLMLPSAETVEKLSYGDPLFRMPTQSNIPITADREYLADVVGMAPMVPAASRATTRLSNEAADQLVRAITGTQATAPQVLEAAGQMLPMSRITTYHGSPYLFREFDPARVGTGEGAQAYGVGSGYTAEARGVAEGYRKGIKDMGSIKAINEKMDELVRVMESDSEYPGAYRKFKSEKGRKAAEEYDALIQQRSEIRNAPGYLYKGEIPDEILPRFLDWDKPLTKDAPQEVKDSFNSILQKYPELKEPFFRAFRENKPGSHYYAILNDYAKTGDLYKNQLFASKVLEDAGIRGIRYLDQGSRGEGKGTSNFIPFQPEDYRIQEINDRPIGEFFPGLLDQPAQSVSSSLLDDIVKKAQDKKIDLQVAETDSLIDVGLIKVPKRGKGLGTETMQELTEYADRTGKPIRLIPDPNIAKNVDPERLVSFYERLGFVKQEPVTSQAESGSTFRQFAPTYWVYTPK